MVLTILPYAEDLNWLAILVAAVAWFIYSAIYYSFPPISRAWQKATGVPDPGGPPPVAIMVSSFIVYFVVSTVIALLVAATGSLDFVDGAVLGVTLGIAFGAGGALIVQLYEKRGGNYWLINGINAVISWAIVGGILAVWHD